MLHEYIFELECHTQKESGFGIVDCAEQIN
jgi:hypothetical protein